MSVTQPRPERAEHLAPHEATVVSLAARTRAAREAGKPETARLADDRAVPTPSPVHRLHANLAQLTSAEQAPVEGLYPGWFRLAFPLSASALLWAAILWGVGVFA